MIPVRNVVLAASLGLLLASACTGAETPQTPTVVATTSDASRAPAPSPSARSTTTPSEPRLENVALGRSRRSIAEAVEDLKRIGLWGPLTRDHYVIRIASRPGEHGVPDDGHLADALATILRDERGEGKLCDIVFYPVAMDQDLQRWADFYAAGSLPDPPPGERDFWAAILAHELAHCVGLGKGESFAEGYERRALDLLREAPP